MRIRNISQQFYKYILIGKRCDWYHLIVSVYLYYVHPKGLDTMYNEICSLVWSLCWLFPLNTYTWYQQCDTRPITSDTIKWWVCNHSYWPWMYSQHHWSMIWLHINIQRTHKFGSNNLSTEPKAPESHADLSAMSTNTLHWWIFLGFLWISIHSLAAIPLSLSVGSVCLLPCCASNFTAANADNHDMGSNGGHNWRTQSIVYFRLKLIYQPYLQCFMYLQNSLWYCCCVVPL